MTQQPKTRKAVALFYAGLLALPTTSASAYSQLYVFGDSLSDGGNNGRYTYNGDQNPLYNERIAQHYGLSLNPSNQGGFNYAQAGGVAVPELGPYNTQHQLQQYQHSHHNQADPKGLYIHWIGGNDLAASLAQGQEAGRNTAINSAMAAADQVNQLAQMGAHTIVVPTVPNITLTPAFLEAIITQVVAFFPIREQAALNAAYAVLNKGPVLNQAEWQQRQQEALAAVANLGGRLTRPIILTLLQTAHSELAPQGEYLTNLYNDTQDQLLAQGQGNIVRVDVNALFQEAMADPALYGFNNTAGTPCPPGVHANQCTSATPGFNDELSFLFADGFHPSPATHTIVSQYMISVLDAPIQVAALGKAMNAPIANVRHTLDGRHQARQHPHEGAHTLGVFGGYAGLSGHQHQPHALGDGEHHGRSLTLGLDYALTPNLRLGALLSGHRDTEHPSDGYRYKHRGNVVAAFAQARFADHAWLSADLHRTRSNFERIQRQINLGAATRIETGSTKGRAWGLRLGTGWDFAITPQLSTGPMLQYSWDQHKVDGYAEQDELSTSMRFGQQRYASKVAAIGWRIDSTLGALNPYAHLRHLRQLGDRTQSVRAAIKSTQTSFYHDTDADARSWTDLTVGTSINLGKNLQAYGALSRTNGLKQGEQTRYHLGFNATF
ncbi:MAG: autotransporter domain-containing protein [Neisseriaceae bacterium]|nr:autotransporter domain-containing protein [Neisseriaceae bacterium]